MGRSGQRFWDAVVIRCTGDTEAMAVMFGCNKPSRANSEELEPGPAEAVPAE